MGINGNTEISGLIGYPVRHTFSPIMHNAAFKTLGINAVYLPFEIKPENLKSVMRCAGAFGMSGLNITVPYKEKVLQYLDEIDRETLLIGAVNTIVIKDDKMKGFNTDGRGFVKSLQDEFGILPDGKRFFIMGAGGAARAISFSLAIQGAGRIVLVDDIPKKAADLAKSAAKRTSCDVIALEKDDKAIKEIILNSDVFINATPCGLKPHDPKVIDPDFLRRGMIVYDIIYNPRTTALLRDARNKGARTANGAGMLLNQGALSFSLWTGKKAPVHVMKKALAGIL